MHPMIGTTAGEGCLTNAQVESICASSLEQLPLDGKRLLVLIPDHTRHAPIDRFFRLIDRFAGRRVRRLDYLIATGTHQPMSMERIYRHVGVTPEEHRADFPHIRFFNHDHQDRSMLVSIGRISGSEIRTLTGGLFTEDIDVTINAMVLHYDHVLIVSPVVPHEAMGFAGGNKYFFPGIGGVDLIQTFHWLAAMITNPVINGVKDTPTRRVIDRAATLLPVPRSCFAFTINHRHEIASLYAGTPEEAWSSAADSSAQLHIRYLQKPVRQILGVTPSIYEEVWVGGKAMYKLEPVVADGGELIIYGPQITAVSFVHGEAICRIGYHVRDYFTGQWDRFRNEPKLILAHSTNVRGVGTYRNGKEEGRIAVTLATGIPKDVCDRINLGYRDPASIDLAQWRSQQTDDRLVVEEAGQVLYRLRNGATVNA